MISCSLNGEGFQACDVEITRLFTRGQPYTIVTRQPYLVVETNLTQYAFIDTGFSGAVERMEIDTHDSGQWEDVRLNSAVIGRESQILMVGLKALKKFPSMLIDYEQGAVTMGAGEPSDSEAVRLVRSFKNFESEMYAIEMKAEGGALSEYQPVQAVVYGFVDSGNPDTFVMNAALSEELAEFKVNSKCDCSRDDIERVTVQNATLALKEQPMTLSINGLPVTDKVRIVCDESDTRCGTRSYNVVIRNPQVKPSVGISVGNDILTKFAYVFFDFHSHALLVPSAPVQAMEKTPESVPMSRQSIARGRSAKPWWRSDIALVFGVSLFMLVAIVALTKFFK